MKKSATNSAIMKQSNRHLILSIIRKRPSSRAELAGMTGLTRAAVTMIVDELLKDELLTETGSADADLGRKPVILDLNAKSLFAVGLYIARKACFICISDIKAKPVVQQEFTLNPSLGVDGCIRQLIDKTERIISESGVPGNKIIGIGIAVPGPVDVYNGTIMNPPNFDLFHNVNIAGEFKKHFEFPVYIENNAAALALAEKAYGAGIDFDSFMLLLVNDGIGAGIVIDDKLYKGEKGFGSEVGHTTIDFNGRLCSCGNKGCIETYASVPSVIEALGNEGIQVDSWEAVVEGALNGNEKCRKAIADEARYLSACIVNVMNILELKAVILAGDISYKPKLLIGEVRKNVENTSITRNLKKLYIMNSSIEDGIEAKAAASIVLDCFFN